MKIRVWLVPTVSIMRIVLVLVKMTCKTYLSILSSGLSTKKCVLSDAVPEVAKFVRTNH